MNRIVCRSALFSVLAIPLAAQDWPAFRGPAGDGVATVESAPLRWDTDANIAWRVRMPRPANGSPIVAKRRVFVTSALDPKGTKRALLCFDRKDGEELWRRVVKSEVMPTHKTNPYCGTTPVTDGERVVVWHGSAGLYCYDLDGEELWKRELGPFRHRWGYGTSPILHAGHVILHSGPGRRVFVAAFRLADGETVWKRQEPVEGDGQDNLQKRYMGSWSTPIVARVGGREQVICALATRLVAYAPISGEILWWCDGFRNKRGDLAYQSPSIADGILTIISGYSGPGLGVRLDAKSEGDVTSTHRLWRHKVHNQSIGSGVVVDGLRSHPPLAAISSASIRRPARPDGSSGPSRGNCGVRSSVPPADST